MTSLTKMYKPKCTQYITRWLFKVGHLFIYDSLQFWTGITCTPVHCTIVFFISPFQTTHNTQKGLTAQNLKPLFWGAGVKRSIVKPFLSAPFLNGWLTQK